jgi:hypothetical protein
VSEILVEIGLRVAKVVVAGVLGLLIYLLLVGPFGAPASVQLALESFLAGAAVVLLAENGIF